MKSIRNEIIRDSKIFVSLEAAIKLIKWVFTLFLSWLLSPTLFGIIGIIKIYEDFLPVLLTYGQNIVQQRYFYEYKTEFEKKKFFFDAIVITIIFNSFLVIASCLIISFLNFSIVNLHFKFYDYILISTVIFLPIRIMVFNYYRLMKEKKEYIYYNIFFEVGRIVIFGMLFLFSFDVIQSYIISLFLLSFIVFVELFRILGNNWSKYFPIKKQNYVKNTILGFFLSALTISSLGSFYIIRYVIEGELGLPFVGYFLLGFTILQIIPFIARGINLAFIPIFFENLNENKATSFHYLKRITDANILVVIVYSTLVIVAFAIFKHFNFIGVDVNNYVIEIIPFLALSYALSSIISFLNQSLLAEKKEKLIGYISLAGLVIMIVVSYPLVDYLGFMGAGVAIIVFNLIVMLSSAKLAKENYHSRNTFLIIAFTFVLQLFIVYN